MSGPDHAAGAALSRKAKIRVSKPPVMAVGGSTKARSEA